jgi:protein TonB
MTTFPQQIEAVALPVRGAMLRQNLPRYATATVCVLALHAAGLWVSRNGLLTRQVEIVVPVQLMATLVDAPAPAPATAELTRPAPAPASPPPTPANPAPKTVKPAKAEPVGKPQPVPAPQTPTAAAQPAPAPIDPAPSAMGSNATPAANTSIDAAPSTVPLVATDMATRAAEAAAAVTPSPARSPTPLELPSSDAQYLKNPKPRYPPISLRSGEQGTVLIEVLVSDTGRAQDVRIKTSSSFFRLDDAALSTLRTWRFVPGKRAGVAQTMWFTVPITFGLQ